MSSKQSNNTSLNMLYSSLFLEWPLALLFRNLYFTPIIHCILRLTFLWSCDEWIVFYVFVFILSAVNYIWPHSVADDKQKWNGFHYQHIVAPSCLFTNRIYFFLWIVITREKVKPIWENKYFTNLKHLTVYYYIMKVIA